MTEADQAKSALTWEPEAIRKNLVSQSAESLGTVAVIDIGKPSQADGLRLADGSVVTTLSEKQLIQQVTPKVVGVGADQRDTKRGLALGAAAAKKILVHFGVSPFQNRASAKENVIRLVNILRGLFDLDPHAAEGAEAAAVASGATEVEAEDRAQEQQEEETEETIADRMRKRRRYR